MITRHQGATLVLATLLGLAACAPDSPTGPTSPGVEPSYDRGTSRADQVRPTDAQVRAHWTADRMARAVPRDYVIDANGQIHRGSPARLLRGRPPREGSDVTGASWAGDGDVLEATGRAYFTLDDTDYTCSGAIVKETKTGRIVILTAAHCVFDEVNDAFASYFAFIANYDARTAFFEANGGCAAYPTQCWVARGLVATQRWADGDADEANFDADFAFAVIDYDEADFAPSPGYELMTTGAPPDPVTAFGYPAEKGWDGTDLIYCYASTTIEDPYDPSSDWGLKCDMEGGSSGGAWLAGTTTATTGTSVGTIVSVVSYGYLGGPYKKYLFGPLFGPLTGSTLTAAINLPPNTTEKLVS